jgi:hypothetical protein
MTALTFALLALVCEVKASHRELSDLLLFASIVSLGLGWGYRLREWWTDPVRVFRRLTK